MKFDIIIWNCQGATNLNFHRILKEYLRDPDLVILMETRVSVAQADDIIRRIGMPNSHKIKAKSFSDGIWELRKDCVEVVVEVNRFQFVHLKVKFPNFSDCVFFSRIYVSPNRVKRKELCSNLGIIAQYI